MPRTLASDYGRAVLGAFGHRAGEPLRSCGADDFSYYTAAAPSPMMFAGTDHAGAPADTATPHRPTFLPGDAAIGHVADALLAAYLAAARLA